MNDEVRTKQDDSKWEKVDGANPGLLRMKVPGGWLVTVVGGFSYPVSFYPDPEHDWNPRIQEDGDVPFVVKTWSHFLSSLKRFRVRYGGSRSV